MNRYAIIENGKIDNIVVATEALDQNWVELDNTAVQIGWLYDGVLFSQPQDPVTTIEVSNIVVTPSRQSTGGVWWVPVGVDWELTANIPLPDGEFMVMLERILDGVTPIDDERFIATISGGSLSLKGRFSTSGNYSITKDRLNRGLAREGFMFRLSFDKVEFDAYRNLV